MKSGNRFTLVLVSIALGALSLLALEDVGDRVAERVPHAGTRLPVANPPADPNRPDLFEEPAIDE